MSGPALSADTSSPSPASPDEEQNARVLDRCPALASLWSSGPGAQRLRQRLARTLQRGLIPKNTRFDRLEWKLLFIASGRARVTGPLRQAPRLLQAGSILRLEPLVAWVRGRAPPLEGVALTDLEVLALPPSLFLEVFGDADGRGALEHLLAIHDMRERTPQIVQTLAMEPRLANVSREHLSRLAESAVAVCPSVQGLLPARTGHPHDFDVLLEGACWLNRELGQGALRSAPACIGLLETLGAEVSFASVSAGPRSVFARISGALFQQLRASEPNFDLAIQRGNPDVVLQPPREPVPHQFILLDGTETLRQLAMASPSRLAPLLAERLAAHLHEHVLLVRLLPGMDAPSAPSPLHVPEPAQHGWWQETWLAWGAVGRKPLAKVLEELAPDPWQLLPGPDGEQALPGKRRRSAGDVNVTLLDVSGLTAQERDAVLHALVRDQGRLGGPVKLAWMSEAPATCQPQDLPKGVEVIPTGVLLPGSLGELLKPGTLQAVGRALLDRHRRARLLLPTLLALRNRLGHADEPPLWPIRTVRLRIRPEWLLDDPPTRRAAPLVSTEDQEAIDRWARALTGRRVGLALGGGGALSFAHVGLIHRLRRKSESEQPLPIDLISGSSFGSMVGAFYSAAGPEGLRRLVSHPRRLRWAVWLSILDNSVMRWWTNLELGWTQLQQLEVPFFPVVTDLDSGMEWDVRHGSIGLGVQASGSLPPTFSPTRIQGRRLIDGGVAANVPVNVLRVEGADIIVASNPIPRLTAVSRDVSRRRMGPRSVVRRLAQHLPPVRRMMEGFRAQGLMVRTAGESQELGPYTVVFKPEYNPAHLTSFGAGRQVARDAEESDDALRVAFEIKRLWRSRLNNPVSFIKELQANTFMLRSPLLFTQGTLALQVDSPLLFALIERLHREPGMRHATLTVTASTQQDAMDRARVLTDYLRPFVAQTLAPWPAVDPLLPKAHTHLQVALSSPSVSASQPLVANSFAKAIEHYRQVRDEARLARSDVQLHQLLEAAEAQARSGDPELARLLALQAVEVARRLGTTVPLHPAWQDRVLRAVLRRKRLLLHKLDYQASPEPAPAPSSPSVGARTATPVRALAWSPDGRHLAIGGQWNTLQLHDLAGEHPPLSLDAGEEECNAVLWMDGRLIASSTRRIDVFAHEPSRREFSRPQTLDPETWDQWGLSASADGKWLLATSASDTPTSEEPGRRATNVGLFSLEARDARARPLGMHVYADRSWEPLHAWSTPPAFRARWRPVCWAPREQRFAVAGVTTDTGKAPRECVRLWRIVDGEPLIEHEHTLPLAQARTVAWHPGGERLAAGGAEEAALLWVSGPEPRVVRLPTGGSPVDFVDWSPDGRRLATAGALSPTVRIWSAEGVLEDVVRLPERPEGLAWGPHSMPGLLALWHGAQLTVWDAVHGQQRALLTGHQGQVRHAAWNPRGRLASGGEDGTVRIWEVQPDAPTPGGLRKAVQEAHPLWLELLGAAGVQQGALDKGVLDTPVPEMTAAAMAEPVGGWELPLGERRWATFSPDGTRAVVAREDWELVLVSSNATVQLAPAREVPGHTRAPRAVWSPDSQSVALWDASDVSVWRVGGPEGVRPMRPPEDPHAGELVALAWSPCGTRLALSWWTTGVQLWTADEALGRWTSSTTLENEVWWMSWSPCGTKLALACNASRDVRIHGLSRTEGPHLLGTLPHHSQPVRVAWNPRGTLLASGDRSGAVQIWSTQGEDLVQSPQERLKESRHLVWSPEGDQLLSVAEDGRALLWVRAQRGWVIGAVPQEGTFPVRWAAFTPDGHWVALMAEDSAQAQLRLLPADLDTLVGCVRRLPWRASLTEEELNKYLRAGKQHLPPRPSAFRGEPPSAR